MKNNLLFSSLRFEKDKIKAIKIVVKPKASS